MTTSDIPSEEIKLTIVVSENEATTSNRMYLLKWLLSVMTIVVVIEYFVLGQFVVENSFSNTMKNVAEYYVTNDDLEDPDETCPAVPPNLEGPITANLTEMSLSDLDDSYLNVMKGGRYAPKNCKARDKVAIVVPYRDREPHLAIFLNNLHPFLMKQQIDYRIFIVEQDGDEPFNRGSLMNVGFAEAMKIRPWDCFIFHDVDLIPLDDRNLYTCPQQPRHLAAGMDKFHYKLPYSTFFGGVCALTTEQFKTINGFSNKFWGWGGEDDDVSNRVYYHNFFISRYSKAVSHYTMLFHKPEDPSKERFNVLEGSKHEYETEGLNTLQYTPVNSEEHHLFTRLLVELHRTDKPKAASLLTSSTNNQPNNKEPNANNRSSIQMFDLKSNNQLHNLDFLNLKYNINYLINITNSNKTS